MSRTIKIWLIVATSLILAGLTIFSVVMFTLKWDFMGLTTMKYQTNQYEIEQNYKNISINTKTADVVFLPSQDGKSTVVCYEQVKLKHSVKVENDTLFIEFEDSRKWYEYIGIDFKQPKITVSIPQGEYGELTVKNTTGKVNIGNEFKFESIDVLVSTGKVSLGASALEFVKIKATTGDIDINGISSNKLDISLSTGDVSMKNVIVNGKLTIKASTGDVSFTDCDANEIYITTSTGSVKGSLLSEKVFIVETDTGRKDVPKTTTGGRCEITTSTGDIKITLK